MGASYMNGEAKIAFALRLIEAREDLGINKSEAARRMGMSPTAYGKWEAGKTCPMNRETFCALAKMLGVTEKWLRLGDGEKSIRKAEEIKMEAKAEKIERESFVVRASDTRKLKDIQLVIAHLRELNISRDEKEAVYRTLAELRNEIEMDVALGVRPSKEIVATRTALGL